MIYEPANGSRCLRSVCFLRRLGNVHYARNLRASNPAHLPALGSNFQALINFLKNRIKDRCADNNMLVGQINSLRLYSDRFAVRALLGARTVAFHMVFDRFHSTDAMGFGKPSTNCLWPCLTVCGWNTYAFILCLYKCQLFCCIILRKRHTAESGEISRAVAMRL